jgi:multidrug efflux pump subunit AcrA (membrane-fusion protein)
VTAEQLAADVAAVAQAKADVTLAEKQAASGTLTAPVSGTIATVTIAEGDTVSAGSSSDTITVLGAGLSVAVSVPLAKIDLIKLGQSAAVTVDGRTTPLAAKVTDVGLLNSSDSTGSSSTYTVTVQLDEVPSKLYDGMGAQVAIAVGTARDVLVVPLSAIHTSGTRNTVEMLKDGKPVATSVALGVIGAADAQVTKGVSAGDQIVLADSSLAIPTSSSDTTGTRGSTGALSGLTGGSGGAGGGFGGGPPGGR